MFPTPEADIAPARIGVAGEEGLADAAEQLAAELSLPWIRAPHDVSASFDLLLLLTARRLELSSIGADAPGPIFVEFRGALPASRGHRRHASRAGRSRPEPLALAIGLRSGKPTVIDATAGLGGDAFHLASLGCTVTAIERSAVMAALVGDGLDRARSAGDERLASIVERITLVQGDARTHLTTLSGDSRPDVVYLDPMYTPVRGKTLAKKEMRICRQVVGDDADAQELFECARQCARKRVVVKRHRRAPALGPPPSTKYVGTTVRYDVHRIG